MTSVWHSYRLQREQKKNVVVNLENRMQQLANVKCGLLQELKFVKFILTRMNFNQLQKLNLLESIMSEENDLTLIITTYTVSSTRGTTRMFPKK